MILKRELDGCNIILSVGCGTAVHEIQLAKSNPDFKIICLDPSKVMLGESQDLSMEIKLFRGMAEQLPFKNEAFDCAYYITSFEFIEDSLSLLNETSRVLKPMGNALFFILNFNSMYYHKKYFETGSYIASNVKHFDNSSLKEAIAKKFEIISARFELGINGDEVFDTEDPKWASLYIIKAVKKVFVG